MAAAAMMFAACQDDVSQPLTPDMSSDRAAVAGATPVGFSAYTDRGVTRAGTPGPLTTTGTDGSVSLASEGFGVFAYSTGANYYTGTTKPDFMYNQKVSMNNVGSWAYDPVKYWPNEYGSKAQSEDTDMVSFFAYAPYVESDPAKIGEGAVVNPGSSGIMGFTRNNASGDPMVKYISTFNPANQVDLSWGVVPSTSTSWATFNGTQSMVAGKPWIDVEHPANLQQPMKLSFRHALAQLNVQIDVDADVDAHTYNAAGPDAKTKVYVRSVKFSGLAQQGTLNLNNTSANNPLWLNYNGQGLLSETEAKPVTISGGNLNSEIRYIDSNSKGVTGQLVNLFNVDGVTGVDQTAKLEAPVFVIPNGQPVEVTIVYNVETEDANLAGVLSDGVTHGSLIENTITKQVRFSGSSTLAAGYKHTLRLHLGLNSVKFEAEMTDWQSAIRESETWVPENKGVGSYNPANPLTIISSDLGTNSVGLDGASATSYQINGLGVGKAVKLGATGTATWTVSDPSVALIAEGTSADADTRAEITFTEDEWKETIDAQRIWIKPLKKGTVTITSNMGGNISTIVITIDAPWISFVKITGEAGSKVETPIENLTLYKFVTGETQKIKGIYHKSNTDGGAVDADKSITLEVVTPDGEDAKATVDAAGVLTPSAVGTTTVKGLINDGGVDITAELPVTIIDSEITSAATEVGLRMGYLESQKLSFSMTPAIDKTAGYEPVFSYSATEDGEYTTTNTQTGIFTFDEEKFIVTAVAVGEGFIKVQFKGHIEATDQSVIFHVTIQSGDPGIAKGETGFNGPDAIGKILADNGKAYNTASEAKLWGHNPIAIIGYYNDAAAQVDSSEGVSYNYLALALTDKSVKWDSRIETEIRAANELVGGTAYNTTALWKSHMKGIDAYNAMLAHTEAANGHTHPAATAVADLALSLPSDLTNSGWFLPTMMQFSKVVYTLAERSEDKIVDYTAGTAAEPKTDYTVDNFVTGAQLNAVLSAKAGESAIVKPTSAYWSSTEYSATNAWYFVFARGRAGSYVKWNSYYVRPVLAF